MNEKKAEMFLKTLLDFTDGKMSPPEMKNVFLFKGEETPQQDLVQWLSRIIPKQTASVTKDFRVENVFADGAGSGDQGLIQHMRDQIKDLQALLAKQLARQTMPAEEMQKLEAKALIVDEQLTRGGWQDTLGSVLKNVLPAVVETFGGSMIKKLGNLFG